MTGKAFMIAMMGAATACAATEAPYVDAVEPAAAAPGEVVNLRGGGFCGAPERVGEGGVCTPLPAGTVHFGIDPYVSATATRWRDDAIEVVVPPQLTAGEVLVVVTVDGRSSNGVSFRVR